MAHLELAHVDHALDDGRPLLNDVSLRIGEGAKVALVGPNGIGKTTLLGLLDGRIPVQEGVRGLSGRLGVMRQSIGSIGGEATIRGLFLTTSPPAIREAAEAHDRWFARRFDRFLVFDADGRVREADEPDWAQGHVRRAR